MLPAIYIDTELKIGALPIRTTLQTKMRQKMLPDYDGNYVLESTTVVTPKLLKILASAQRIRKPVSGVGTDSDETDTVNAKVGFEK